MSWPMSGCARPRHDRSVTRGPLVRGALSTCAFAVLSTTLSGCAVYHRKPLPPGPDLAGAAALRVSAGNFGLPGLKAVSLDPKKGFSAVNLMELAVAGDPQLSAARARAGVAGAQLLAAGLLPDPQISAGWSKSPVHTGYSIGVMEDVRALLTMPARKAAAAAGARQVNLEILWQEWQVAERARELFLQARESQRLRAVLAPELRLLTELVARDERELARGEVGSGSVAAELDEWNAAEKQWRALALQDNLIWHDIDGLLGLEPGTRLRLRAGGGLHSLSSHRFHAALLTLPRRRPDLLALRAGYESTQERLRVQILRQFPMIDGGVHEARSAEEGIQTIGFDVRLSLPLFNRNRGGIAIARASRRYLYRLYQARLDAAVNQADQLFDAERIMRRQLHAANARFVRLEPACKAARSSFQRGELDLAKYTAVVADIASAQAQIITLRASLARARSALDMLLARPL